MCHRLVSAVDKPKFMGRLQDHPCWETGLSKSFLGCQIILTYFKINVFVFLVINTKFACFLFNHVPTYRGLDRLSGDFGGHVGWTDRVTGRIWRLADLLSTAVLGAFRTNTKSPINTPIWIHWKEYNVFFYFHQLIYSVLLRYKRKRVTDPFVFCDVTQHSIAQCSQLSTCIFLFTVSQATASCHV